MHGTGLFAVNRRTKRILAVAGVGLTLAAFALPAQVLASGGKPAGGGVGHKVGH